MKRWLTSVCLTLCAGGVVVSYPRVSSACEPATDYEIEVSRQDLPDCVKIESVRDDGNFQTAPMRVTNECDRPLSLAAPFCELCSEPLSFAAGEQRELRLDRGGIQDAVNQVDFTWEDQTTSGTFEVTVTTWSDGCGAGLFGCRCFTSTAPGRDTPGLAVLVGLFLLLRRRRNL